MVGDRSGYKNPTAAIPLGIGSLFVCLLLLGCSNEGSDSTKFFNEKLACPAPAVDEFQGWGKSGTQHVCKIKHGPFVAWENGYIHLRGQYENGKETGVWYWYDKKGNVVKKIDYTRAEQPEQPGSSG